MSSNCVTHLALAKRHSKSSQTLTIVHDTGNTLGLALWLLATNRPERERLQAEIDAAHAAGETDESGRLTYSALMGMEYLDMVVQEVTRRFPPLGSIISRDCSDHNHTVDFQKLFQIVNHITDFTQKWGR